MKYKVTWSLILLVVASYWIMLILGLMYTFSILYDMTLGTRMMVLFSFICLPMFIFSLACFGSLLYQNKSMFLTSGATVQDTRLYKKGNPTPGSKSKTSMNCKDWMRILLLVILLILVTIFTACTAPFYSPAYVSGIAGCWGYILIFGTIFILKFQNSHW